MRGGKKKTREVREEGKKGKGREGRKVDDGRIDGRKVGEGGQVRTS